MTPLRNNRANNRANRGQIDHDIMEGLPVRQWRKQATLITSAAPRDSASAARARNPAWRELPMPLGSELYSPTSAALLRAARLGQLNRPTPSAVDEDRDAGDDEDEEEEETAATATVTAPEADAEPGFVAARWNAIPRDAELPEPEFLAPRRKGLPSLHDKVVQADVVAPGPMRKTKIRKTDGEGHSSVWDVLVPEGAVVEGEILDGDEVLTEAVAPGTVVEGVGVANADGIVIAGDPLAFTPQKKKYHPPKLKRKGKGPGRGRRKFQRVVVSGVAAPDSVPAADGATTNQTETTASTSLKPADASKTGAASGDVTMREGSAAVEGEEGSDDDDEDDDDAEDADREEGELSPTPEPEPRAAPPVPVAIDVDMADVPPRDLSSSPDLPLAAAAAAQQAPVINVVAASEVMIAVDQDQVAGVEPMALGHEEQDAKHTEPVEQQENRAKTPSIAPTAEQTTQDAPSMQESLLAPVSDVVTEPAPEILPLELSQPEPNLLSTQSALSPDLAPTTTAPIEEDSALPVVSADETLLPTTTTSIPPSPPPPPPASPPKATSSPSPDAATSLLAPDTASQQITSSTTTNAEALEPNSTSEPNTALEPHATSSLASSALSSAPDVPDAADASASAPTSEAEKAAVAESGEAATSVSAEADGTIRFADGEMDLLGNLERSLNDGEK